MADMKPSYEDLEQQVKILQQALESSRKEREGHRYFGQGKSSLEGADIYENDSGEIIGFQGATRDISQRKRSEDILQESKERFQLAMEATRDGIWDWNVQTDKVYFSPAYLAMLGYSMDEKHDCSSFWADRIHPDDKEEVLRVNMDCIENKREEFEVEFRMQARDGQWRWVMGKGKVVDRDNQGRALRMIGTHSDITIRKKNEEELRKLQMAVKYSPSVIIITDTQGLIEYVNPAFTSLTEYTPEEVIGHSLHIFHSDRIDQNFYEHIWPTIQAGQVWRGEIVKQTKTGKTFWVNASIAPVRNQEEKVIKYIGVEEDITDKKDLEKLKDDVQRMMRHDLKCSLSSLMGLPQMLKQDSNLSDEQREIVGLIESTGLKINRMIDLSLDLFKMEKGTYEFLPQEVDVLHLIHQVIEQYQWHLTSKNLTVKTMVNGQELFPGQRVYIQSEELLLYFLFCNLVINAIEASPQGEEIQIDIHSCDPLIIRIHNKGVVPQVIRKNFFDKFKTSGKASGIGMGTYSAKLMAETMNYKIRMDTSDKKGTTCISLFVPRNGQTGKM